MSYILFRVEDGYFVCPGGQKSSYTKDLTKAKQFQSSESAEKERCENERIVTYEEAGR